MGNYKTRPKLLCTQEFIKRVIQIYDIAKNKISEEFRTDIPYQFEELFQFFKNGNKEFSLSLSIENFGILESGLSLLHACCILSYRFELDLKNENNCALCVLRLSKEKSKNKDKQNVENFNCLRKASIEFGHFLIQKGADPSVLSTVGFSPFHLASYKGDVELLQIMAEKCTHLDHTGIGSMTALHFACLSGNLEAVQYLAQKGANIEAKDALSFSPLHIACLCGYTNIVKYFLSRGVDVNVCGSVGDRPIHLAAYMGYIEIVKLLTKKSAKVHAQNEEGNTALHLCALGGYTDILNYLLQPQFNTDPHLTNIYLDTAFHLSCYWGNVDCAKSILVYGGSSLLVKENIWHETGLHAACTGGKSIELIIYLLNFDGCYINHQGRDGHTPLHSACFHGNIKVVQLLLSHGADVNLTAREPFSFDCKDEQTPLIWAYDNGHDDIVNLLKHFRRPGILEENGRGEYFTGFENTYFPIPSPVGKLKTIIREKIDVFHLRLNLPTKFHLILSDIEHLENISSGSFGKVFKGKFGDKIVAVKKYKANIGYGKTDVEMFCREVSILGSLDSPYIVKFLGACLLDPSQFAIVTEFVSRGSLFTILHEQKQSLDTLTRLSIALDVAKGMLYLHTLPQLIIHRDLNSHNILLSDEMRARVADFGESRFVSNGLEENMTKQPGNLRWMAPEIFTQCTQYSIKADVFSFGLCLWELLTSELPFAHLKPAAAAADMAYKHSRPPLDRTIPLEAVPLLEQSWHKNPEDRPDFSEVVSELESLIQMEKDSIERGSSPGGDPHCCHHMTIYGGLASSRSISPQDLYSSTGNSELSGHVSALRSRWEQEASRGQTAFRSSHPTLEELRSHVNNKGYVEGNSYQCRFSSLFRNKKGFACD